MAKLSLSWAINRKKRIRVITGLAVLVLLFFGVSMMVSKNPKGTKAAIRTLDGRNWMITNNIACSPVYDSNADAKIEDWDCGGPGPVVITTVNIATTDDVVLNGGGAANSYKFIMFGNNHFKSLTVQNNAMVTHEGLVLNRLVPALSDVAADRVTIQSEGLIKKVDLEVDGAVTLTTGGSINANGKGYPGGYGWAAIGAPEAGYGPGRSPGAWINVNNDRAAAAGASFKGLGGVSANAPGALYNQPAPVTNPPYLQLGSGGGAQTNGGFGACASTGGNGGGRIKIQADSIIFQDSNTFISANGATLPDYGAAYELNRAGCESSSGGGSGGSVWIKAGSLAYPQPVISYSPASVAGGIEVNHGSPGAIDPIGNSDALFNIFSQGGNAYNQNSSIMAGGSGGGGHIVFEKVVNQPVTIKKTLESVNRDGAPDNGDGDKYTQDGFNPYALQKDDYIRVILDVSNITPSSNLHMEEEVLHIEFSNPPIYCNNRTGVVYVNTSPATTIAAPTWVFPLIKFDYPVPALETSQKFWYYCTVE